MLRRALCLALVASSGIQALGQAPATTGPTFEVASIKPNKSGQRGSTINDQLKGRFVATNVTLVQLVTWAHGLRSFQVMGGPSWADSEHFDVLATSEDGVVGTKPEGTTSRSRLMLRSLLNERFMLKAHTETRELPIYALVLARDDKRLGPQIAPSEIDCVALRAQSSGIPAPAPAPGARRPCLMTMAAGRIVAGSTLIANLATQLSAAVERIVEDRTGLAGRFDFDLLYATEVVGGAVTNAPALSPSDSDRPSLFTALQEQLGLKLESTRGPVEVLVIDSVEHPTPD